MEKEKISLATLKKSGKSWCSRCRKQDIELMKYTRVGDKQYFVCKDCNAKKCIAYYRTKSGKEAVLRANKKYIAKKLELKT